MQGGKRDRAGRKSEIVRAQDSANQRDYIEAFMDRAVEDLPRYYEALNDLALGVKEFRRIRRAKHDLRSVASEEAILDEEGEECWLYTHLPDRQALIAIVEHIKGKAAQQARVERDYSINVYHSVPRAEVSTDRPELAGGEHLGADNGAPISSDGDSQSRRRLSRGEIHLQKEAVGKDRPRRGLPGAEQ